MGSDRATPLEPGKGERWTTTVRELIHKLEDSAPRGYDGRRIAPYNLANPNPRGDYSPADLDVVRRAFAFNGGRVVVVRLQRVAFVSLLHAMRERPEIEVGFGDGHFASYRTYEMQAFLRENYLEGGPLAAAPGPNGSWHQGAIAVDLTNAGPAGSPIRRAMEDAGFEGLLPQDPPHHTYGRRG